MQGGSSWLDVSGFETLGLNHATPPGHKNASNPPYLRAFRVSCQCGVQT